MLMIYLLDFEMHLSHPGEFVSRRSSTHCQAAWWLRNALLNWAFRLIRVPGRSLKSRTSLWALLNPYNPLSTLTIKHSNRFTMKLRKIVTVRSGDLAGVRPHHPPPVVYEILLLDLAPSIFVFQSNKNFPDGPCSDIRTSIQ